MNGLRVIAAAYSDLSQFTPSQSADKSEIVGGKDASVSVGVEGEVSSGVRPVLGGGVGGGKGLVSNIKSDQTGSNLRALLMVATQEELEVP